MPRRKIESSKRLAPESALKDRSELSFLYPKAKPINPNPISTPAEIAERHQKAHDKQVRSLRRSALRIGLLIAVPYVLGLFTVQQVVLRIQYIAPNDIGTAMFIVFGSFLFAMATIAAAYFLLKRVEEIFNNHSLTSWPITAAVIVGMIGATPSALEITHALGSVSYLASLVIIAAVSIVSAVGLICAWTSTVSVRVKIAILAIYMVIFLVLLFQ